MKKLITLFAIAGMVLALAPAAQANIVATSELDGWLRTESGTPVNWDVTDRVVGRSAGTLDIDGGSVLDTNTQDVFMGSYGTATGTITVTGSGSKYVSTNMLRVGRPGATGTLNIENGGWADLATMNMNEGGAANVTVTGAGSKLTASNRLQVGRVGTPSVTLTVADGGLVQTALLQFGEGGEFTVGNVHMAVGGILAVSGNKTANPFVNGGLFTFSGTPTSEIQYDPGTGFENMTGATAGTDYTLALGTGDLDGYTVLTMVPEPATMLLLGLGGMMLRRRRRA